MTTTVFRSGEEGYHTYRIPALIRVGDVVLAFCEGRQGRADHSANDIVLKRSTDRGASWSPIQVVASHGDDCLNNPEVILSRRDGRLILVYQRHPHGFDERAAVPGIGVPGSVDVFLRMSDDQGKTWTEHRDITAGTKRPEYVTSLASGPGIGIELEHGPFAGRLVLPFNQGPYGDWRVYAALSDDRGLNWRIGDVAPEGSAGHGNEVQMAELTDGRILLNCRSQGGAKSRKQAVSNDGGESWSPLQDVPALTDPECMGSIISHRGTLLLSNAASSTVRNCGTVRMSTDDGTTWEEILRVTDGPYAYSCLTSLDDNTAACLYETGESGPYERIDFMRFQVGR